MIGVPDYYKCSRCGKTGVTASGHNCIEGGLAVGLYNNGIGAFGPCTTGGLY